jgi:hypothetical protein
VRAQLIAIVFLTVGCPPEPTPTPRPGPAPACVGPVGFDRNCFPNVWTEDLLDCRICDSASSCVAPGNWYCVSRNPDVGCNDGRCSRKPEWQKRHKPVDAGPAVW